jgi:hypothetical protein
MQLKVYSVYDNKTKTWANPMVVREAGYILREFADIANDKTHPWGKHPEDYCLFEIGLWDDSKGVFTQHNNSTNLGLAAAYVKERSAAELKVTK